MCQTCERYRNTELRDFVQSVHEKEVPTKEKPAPADSAVASGTDRSKEHEYGQDKEHKHSLWKEIQKFFRVPDDPDLDVDDNVDPDDPDDEALRENIMELFCDARSQGKTIPQEEWKRLGIGYGPVGGQQFPEACSMELMKLGPQGEPIERCIACLCGECLTHDSEFRYSEDQPRDPDGKFGSGGGGSPKDQKIGDKVKDVFGNEGTVKGWHGQSGTVQVDVAGKLQYWHPSQLQRGLYVHCGPQGEILFAPAEVRFNPDQPRDEKGQWTSTTAPQMTAAGNPHPHAGKSIEHPSTKDLTEPQAKFMADECIKTGIARGKDEGIARGRNWLRSRALGRDFGESSEDYEKRNPEIPQFREWLNTWESGKRSFSELTEERYSEDQSRDPDGKFASGGSGGRVR